MAAGWHLCIRIAELMMGGTPFGHILGNDAMHYGWQELRHEYAEMMVIDVAED